MTQRVVLIWLATASMLAAALVGCGGGSDGVVVPPPLLTPSSASSPSSAAPTPTDSTTSTAPSPSATTAGDPEPVAPELVRFGRNGKLLSLVVRNVDQREVSSATVLISLYDSQHHLLLATVGQPRSTCCTIVRLPPGKMFGLFVNLDRPARDVASVEVRYTHVTTVAWPRPRPTTITARHLRLTRTRGDAVVTATVRVHGPLRPFIVGQALLVGPAGNLRAVISGRFYCFHDGTVKTLRMQLLHPVPPGTRVVRVLAYPIPRGQPTLVRGSCH